MLSFLLHVHFAVVSRQFAMPSRDAALRPLCSHTLSLRLLSIKQNSRAPTATPSSAATREPNLASPTQIVVA
jgi:hypothetical protein